MRLSPDLHADLRLTPIDNAVLAACRTFRCTVRY